VSKGLLRSRPGDKLMLVRSGAGDMALVQGATALKPPGLDPGVADEASPALGSSSAPAAESVAEKRAEARMKGYVGEACPECGNFTMVRNGTCLKCDTCGGTTGCS
jgi:ribonucleoside-diphosphate reductase alpha chain